MTKQTIIRRRALLSTVSNYIGHFITLGTWFLLTPFILHKLGPSTYGLWILVGSVVAYGGLLDFGISNAVTKYVAEYRARGQVEQARSLIATALWLYLALGLLAIAFSAIIAPIFNELFQVAPDERATVTWLVLLSGVGVGISIPCSCTWAVLHGLHRFDLTNLLSSIGVLLLAAATVAVLLLGGNILGLVMANIIVTLVMQVPSIWLIYRITPELRFGLRGARRQLIRTVTSFSSSIFAIQVAGHIQAKTDELVIGAFLPVSNVTPYAFARRLSEVAQTLTDQFVKVLPPLASELHAEEDQDHLRTLYIASTRLTLVFFLPVSCALVILARPLLTVWVGTAYANYAQLVLILSIASLIDTSQWPAASVLQGMARHRPLAVTSICSGLANLALSIVLLRHFGLTGVALGTLIPTSLECLVFVMPYAMRCIGVSAGTVFKEVFWPTLAPAIPMVILLYSLREVIEPSSLLSIVGVAGIGLSVYAIAYLSVGASAIERRTCSDFAFSSIRLAKAHLKRS